MGRIGQVAALQEQAWELQGIMDINQQQHIMTAKVTGMPGQKQSL